MKKIFLIFFILLMSVAAGFFIVSKSKKSVLPDNFKDEIFSQINNNELIEKGREKIENAIPEKKQPPGNFPENILISVPWTSQAPFAVWDARHEDACEEASLIMLKYYLDKKPLTPEIAEAEIQKMIDYEIKNFGRFEDNDAAEMKKIAEDFYGIRNLKVVYDFQKEDLKKYLARGEPIIVPAAGRLLGNPNYKQPGPLYHALVLKGYKGNRIITNDPGTRKGESYEYSLDILYDAIHNFTGKKEDIENGRKAMLVLE